MLRLMKLNWIHFSSSKYTPSKKIGFPWPGESYYINLIYKSKLLHKKVFLSSIFSDWFLLLEFCDKISVLERI